MCEIVVRFTYGCGKPLHSRIWKYRVDKDDCLCDLQISHHEVVLGGCPFCVAGHGGEAKKQEGDGQNDGCMSS